MTCLGTGSALCGMKTLGRVDGKAFLLVVIEGLWMSGQVRDGFHIRFNTWVEYIYEQKSLCYPISPAITAVNWVSSPRTSQVTRLKNCILYL